MYGGEGVISGMWWKVKIEKRKCLLTNCSNSTLFQVGAEQERAGWQSLVQLGQGLECQFKHEATKGLKLFAFGIRRSF